MRKLLSCLVILVLLSGCGGVASQGPQPTQEQSTELTTFQTLQAGKIAYDNSFKALAALDAVGKLSESAKTKAISLGNVYVAAHNQAVVNLLAGKPVNTSAVETALAAFLAYAAELQGGAK